MLEYSTYSFARFAIIPFGSWPTINTLQPKLYSNNHVKFSSKCINLEAWIDSGVAALTLAPGSPEAPVSPGNPRGPYWGKWMCQSKNILTVLTVGIVTHWVSFGSIWSRCASDSWGSCGPRGASITFLAHFAFVSLDIKATGCLVMLAGSKTNEKRGKRKTLLTGGPVSPTFPGFPASPSSPYIESKRDRKKRRKQKERKWPSIILRLTCLRSYRGSTLQQTQPPP